MRGERRLRFRSISLPAVAVGQKPTNDLSLAPHEGEGEGEGEGDGEGEGEVLSHP